MMDPALEPNKRFDGVRAVVIGAGASGIAAAHALLAEGASVLISEQSARASLDDVDEPAISLLADSGATLAFGGHEPGHAVDADLAVVSPGVPEDALVLRWLAQAEVPIISELELGWRLANAPVVAVTGTNGKTTTTELIASCMRASGSDAIACGNIGFPFSAAARATHDLFVVEASSFQLRFIDQFHPQVSVLLNLADDHLDWHGSPEAYAAAKVRIFENQSGEDVHVGNLDDERSSTASSTAACTNAWFTLGDPAQGSVGYVDGTLLHRTADGTDELGVLASTHRGFLADAAAAAAAAIAFGVSADAVREGLASAEPMSHRGEVVHVSHDIAFVDDSKATNPHAVLAALEGRTGVTLIAGGRSKGVDLSPLLLAATAITSIIALGEAADEIEDLFSGIRPVSKAQSIEEAVARAAAVATPGGSVVLAPGCASQDMFKDYKERGDRFAAAARALDVNEAARG